MVGLGGASVSWPRGRLPGLSGGRAAIVWASLLRIKKTNGTLPEGSLTSTVLFLFDFSNQQLRPLRKRQPQGCYQKALSKVLTLCRLSKPSRTPCRSEIASRPRENFMAGPEAGTALNAAKSGPTFDAQRDRP